MNAERKRNKEKINKERWAQKERKIERKKERKMNAERKRNKEKIKKERWAQKERKKERKKERWILRGKEIRKK